MNYQQRSLSDKISQKEEVIMHIKLDQSRQTTLIQNLENQIKDLTSQHDRQTRASKRELDILQKQKDDEKCHFDREMAKLSEMMNYKKA